MAASGGEKIKQRPLRCCQIVAWKLDSQRINPCLGFDESFRNLLSWESNVKMHSWLISSLINLLIKGGQLRGYLESEIEEVDITLSGEDL